MPFINHNKQTKMNNKFSEIDRAVLAAFGMLEETIQHLESIGINDRQTIIDTGGAEKLSVISGINNNLAISIFSWASLLEFDDNDDDDYEENTTVRNTFAIDFSEPIPYTMESYSTYKYWIEAAEANDEIDSEGIEEVKMYYDNLVANPENANSVYNFAIKLLTLVDPAIDKAVNNETISEEAIFLIKTTEACFKKAIAMFNGFGRARIMYASLLCRQQRFKEAIDIVELALSLPEGSEDWMIAARWYLTGKASLNDISGEATIIYQKYKEYAIEGDGHYTFIHNSLCHYF